MEAVRVRIELVGGPLCGKWWPMDWLPDDKFAVAPKGGTPLIYQVETDEGDDQHRASFVGYLGRVT